MTANRALRGRRGVWGLGCASPQLYDEEMRRWKAKRPSGGPSSRLPR